MEEKKEKRSYGDANKKAAVIECVEMGLGYYKAIPVLIEKGFVDENGNCTVNRGSYENYRKKYSGTCQIRIDATPEESDWAKQHEDEILAYIRTRMQMQ